MPGWWADFTRGHSLFGLALVALAGVPGMWLVARRVAEATPVFRKQERKTGRRGDYQNRRISRFLLLLCGQRRLHNFAGCGGADGPAAGRPSVKFLSANPDNSIVLSEEWSSFAESWSRAHKSNPTAHILPDLRQNCVIATHGGQNGERRSACEAHLRKWNQLLAKLARWPRACYSSSRIARSTQPALCCNT
jgi:hypothetical protein